MKRRIAALLLSIAVIGTLIGCGGTAENAAPSGETADTAESAADVIEESAAESAPVTDESEAADEEDEENYETGDASLDDPGNQDEITRSAKRSRTGPSAGLSRARSLSIMSISVTASRSTM